jgi:hypothetical protein
MRLKLKPSVPRRFLFFAGALVWAFAAWRVSSIAITYLKESPWPWWLELMAGMAGLALFFNFVFLRVSRRYIQRIAAMKMQNPCIFAFFGWKSYLLIAIMSGLGIALSKYEFIPLTWQGIFYIALSGSLFLSALMFVNAGILFRENQESE